MHVTEAILQRRSIRSYLPDPVPREAIRDIIRTALWSPSATNLQAWSITVVSGGAKQKLSDALIEANKIDHLGRAEVPYPQLTEELLLRRRVLGYKVYEAKGIRREDREKRIWWVQEMLRFFGAPTGIFIHTPRALTPYLLPDMGMVAMSIMLLATERGLGTCPMRQPLEYPDVIRDHLGIPEDHTIPVSLALGSPDMSDPVNRFVRDREPLEKLAQFVE